MAEKKQTQAPQKFIRLLKKAMDAHPDRLSLRQVATRADISPAYLSLLLNGERSTPSNEAIAQLERVLQIPDGELFKAAGKPTDAALKFFRKDEAGAIVDLLRPLPASQLTEVRRLIERFSKKQQ